MTEKDLIIQLEKEFCIKHSEAEKVVNKFFDILIEALQKNKRIEIRNFGVFYNHRYKEGKYYHVSSRQIRTRKTSVIPRFRTGKNFKKLINDNKDKYPIKP